MSKTVWVTSQGTSNRSRLNSAGCFDRYLSTNSRGEKEGEKHRLSSHSILLFYEQSPLIFLKKGRKVSPISLDSILTVQWRRKPRSTSSCNRFFFFILTLLMCQSHIAWENPIFYIDDSAVNTFLSSSIFSVIIFFFQCLNILRISTVMGVRIKLD